MAGSDGRLIEVHEYPRGCAALSHELLRHATKARDPHDALSNPWRSPFVTRFGSYLYLRGRHFLRAARAIAARIRRLSFECV
jgi:hypothetical protein